jgi:hypothetical protein
MEQKLILKKKVNPDSILDASDVRAIRQFEKEKREGKLISWDKLKEELGVRVRRKAH